MTLDLALFGLAVLLAVVAVFTTRRRPPAFDPERLFKTAEATLLRGEVEAAGGSAEAWAARVTASVLFHPAGREGWAKLDQPDAWTPPVPALPGERALAEDLARLEPGLPRFGRLFGGDVSARDDLLDDPAGLGPAYDPSRWLGAGCTWDTLAAWAAPVSEALARRIGHLRFACIHGPADAADAPALAAALDAALGGGGRVLLLPQSDPAVPEAPAALARGILAFLTDPADRVVPLALGDAGPLVLDALLLDASLRDRTAAVVLAGCPLGGLPLDAPPGLGVDERAAWAAAHLSQDAFDTELKRSVPWLLLPRLLPGAVPAGDGRIPWSHQRLSEPPVPPSGRRPVAVVDLGPVPVGETAPPADVLARALVLVIAALEG